MSVYESDVVRAIRAFKRAVLAHDDDQMRRFARAYLDVELHLTQSIATLSEQLARLAAEGKDVPYWKLARLERFQRLQEQMIEELARFNGWALSQINEAQLRLGVLGMEHAISAMETMNPGISAWLDRSNLGAFRAMVGLAGDGSPLADLLAKSGTAVRRAMLRELQRSIALGRSPRATAAAVHKATNIGLQRALTIARTEQLRVYREATMETYRTMGVQRYEIICALDDRVCAGCLATAGDIVYQMYDFEAHVNCRCSLVPIVDVPGIEMPRMESSRSWFDRQDEMTQLKIMGPGRLAAYRDGTAAWSDLATHTHDPIWGGARVPTPVSKLVAGQAPVAA